MPEKMRDKITEIHNKHKDLISTSCNEYHSHSALKGCLRGPPEALDIAYLFEYILALEAKLAKIKSIADARDIR